MVAQLQHRQTPDRRMAARTQVSLKARVRTPQSHWMDCMIRDVSAMGASLEFDQAVILPEQLILQVPDLLLELECSVRHSSGQRVGVMFISNRQATVAHFG